MQTYKAIPYNKRLVRSINRVTELKSWPYEAGGGPVQDPRALVVLGDMTEFYREDEVDAFRSFYDPSVDPPTSDAANSSVSMSQDAQDAVTSAQVELPTWLMFGNRECQHGFGYCLAGCCGEVPAMRAAGACRCLIFVQCTSSLSGHSGILHAAKNRSLCSHRLSTYTPAKPQPYLLCADDYVINVNDCAGHFKSIDKNVCARTAVDHMRSVLMPGCDQHTWGNFPRNNITSFDAESMAYSFDYNNWHFVVLQYSPR